LFLLINYVKLISQIDVFKICFVLPVPFFTLSSMQFILACRTACLLPTYLLRNRLKPFPANTAGTFSTNVFFDHCIFSSVQYRTKIYVIWRAGKRRRDSGVFFLFLAGYGGGVNPLHYFVTFSGGGRYTI
jgi:hypothetical protein